MRLFFLGGEIMNDTLKEHLKLLPDKPGCYLMKDKNGKIIYVGKAKILKNRVRSYFRGAHNLKTTKLVSEIADFDYIITKSEMESLVLEINLIKQHDPKYNIMLTDDKTYPYILLTSEKYPRLMVIRTKHKTKKAGHFFGPYPNVYAARKTCDLLNKIYPFRKCQNMPKKECLYYHIHQCLGPCINSEVDYEESSKKVISFLNGDTSYVVKNLEEEMNVASSALDFEKAAAYRDLINDILTTTNKQIISTNDLKSKDVFGFYVSDDEISVHVLYIRNGSIVENYHTNFTYIMDDETAITDFIANFYTDDRFKPSEIITTFSVDVELLKENIGKNITIPQKGIKLDLANMANNNAEKDFKDMKNIYKSKVLKKLDTVEELGRILNIPAPYHIEAFDNSNLFGEYPVSAMVVFKNGRPSPKDYRKYHIKTVKGANDYESMKEVIYRRYLRLSLENAPMPDLIVMDGGKIQVNAALEIIKLLNLTIPVMGIEKDDHHKARAIVFNDEEIPLDKNSDLYLLLINISQTVHDFAISFFRSQKAKGFFSSMLDEIPGIGPKKKEAILKKFLNAEGMKNGTVLEYKEIGINENLREAVIKHLNKINDSNKK